MEDDSLAFVQNKVEVQTKPGSWIEKAKDAMKGVDAADIVGAIGAVAKFAQRTTQNNNQWSMPMAGQGAFGQPMYQQMGPSSFGQPMFQQVQPAVYGPQPMFGQLRPATFSQPRFRQMGAPMQDWEAPGMAAAPWQMQMQQRPRAGGNFFTNLMAAATSPQQQQQAQWRQQQQQEMAARMREQAAATKQAAEEAMAQGLERVKSSSKRRLRDLAMVHVPCNFGHTIERAALMSKDMDNAFVDPSFTETEKARQQMYINLAQGPGGEAWGMMAPDLRQVSDATGCDLYYTPQKYWPEAVAKKYFRYNSYENRTVFGVLRDPFDKIVNEFRMQVLGVSSLFAHETRKAISEREGATDRESPEYKEYYENCDVNSWVKAELGKYKEGDRFRGNCHLLPQAEYFEGTHGIDVPIDNRLIPASFNEVMRNHGYDIRMGQTYHNYKCELSAYSLDAEAKELIKEVYAADFELVCKHFGYCDREELTCLRQISHMCGDAPEESK